MKWITNAFNINSPDARRHFICFSTTPEGMDMEWQEYKDWYLAHKIGRPQPPQADSPSVEELEKMGLVGLYEDDEIKTQS